MKQRITAMICALICVCAGVANAAQTNKPNVIFILIDDMGYADTSCYRTSGTPVVTTTNIDHFATQGTRFTQYHSTSPICSPSRTALLSGSQPGRWRITSYLDNKSINRTRNMADFADPQMPSIARAFKAAGYKTGHFGKWHLDAGRNVDDSPLPQAYGFDESLVSFEGLGNRELIEGDGLSNANAQLKQGNLEWMPKYQCGSNHVNAAIAFLAAHTNEPCYVNLWFNDVHTAWQPQAGTWDKYTNITSNTDEQHFYAVLQNLDVQVGRFLTALDNLGIASNSIVIYASDNGAPGDGTTAFALARNGGLRGRKGSVYEGGTRLPFVVRWPGKVPAGRVDTNSIITGIDYLPTVCALANVSVPASYIPDGENMSTAILGANQSRTKPAIWWFINDTGPAVGNYNHAPPLAMRIGKWKVLTDYTKSTIELYDIDADAFETTNVASSQSATANSMADQVIAWWRTMPK
ncbi:MAG: sulfatase-like hydrolase/transferase [Limisphaerales bacterium]